MHKISVCMALLFGLLMASLNRAYAQSITLFPTNPSVAVGKIVAFTAQVNGLSSTAVNWFAGSVSGGNATVGTISANGVYTAPATLPAQNPVQIRAVSAANSSVSTLTYVTILATGPTITSVTPNPLAVGSIAVTIQGTGFLPNATMYVTYGANTRIQMTTQNVTPTSVLAVGYLGPAPSATFCVRNPGSDFSNSITVPVTGGETQKYVLTVNNGTGSGSYAAGTAVTITANAPPAGQTFVNWTGAAVQDANAPTTTLVMPSANTSVKANYSGTSGVVTIPYPVTTHPRLWVTQGDLPRLRSWAVSSNLIYQQGMLPLLNQAVSAYTTQFFPNGAPNPNYPDPGDVQGYTTYLTEHYGAVLAFNSLIDPDATARSRYAQYARNLLMVAMNQAAQGHLANTPFRDPMFAIYNRANGQGEMWPLIVDWIYNTRDAQGNAILTPSDKLTIRNVFLLWANDCLNAYVSGGDHPSPIGVTNSLQLLPNNKAYRVASNNYYLGHARLLTLMALSIDPGDDPLVNSALPASQLGNTLRSYIPNATGAWLYQQFAMMGDASAVANAYGIGGGSAGLGLASGGAPPEGMLYGHSYAYVLGQLLALQTAGFNNSTYARPQIQLINAPVWDRYLTGLLASLTPTAQTPASQPWLGPVYQFPGYGDLLRLWVTPDFMQPFALLALLEQQNGKTTHLDMARWFAVNAVEGGSGKLLQRVSNPWSWSPSNAILYFLLLDPSAPTAADPRPSLPTVFYDATQGHILAHSDWGVNNTLFNYRASWLTINHQNGDGGSFGLYRNGEWLTKEMSNYDNNALGLTTVYHNTLALQNACANGKPSNLQWFESGEWANGSQWNNGQNAGDPTTVMSTGAGYVYAASDLTNLYNRPSFWNAADSAMNITQANRSILWLNNDTIVIYDRVTSQNSGLFKRFQLSLVNNPTIQGNVVTQTLNSGQQLFVQSLLPANPTITAAYAAGNLNPIAQLEPMQYILTVQDASNPTDTRFLHVLQGANPGAGRTPATYVQTTQGTRFDGAIFGNAAVYFPVNANSAFTATTFTVPAGMHTLFVTGLTPNASYGVSMQSVQGGGVIVVTPGGSGVSADKAGVVSFDF